MTVLKIPLQNTGDTRRTVILGDSEITIRTYYNPVVPCWVAEFNDSNNIMDFKGQNLVSGINLLERSPKWTRLFGYFRMTADATAPDSLGDTANLYWFSDQESYEKIFPPIDPTIAPLTYDFDALFPSSGVSVVSV